MWIDTVVLNQLYELGSFRKCNRWTGRGNEWWTTLSLASRANYYYCCCYCCCPVCTSRCLKELLRTLEHGKVAPWTTAASVTRM
ncbi:hypothetical protein JOB18_016317 [Solea senegalensis]|uniref:Uncharacterized protein n=1 Tax=Solea senegalensis TaxID=28829 RepID=A0AAV6RU26_SOLSE|nr:hypothetical protein JOB18_016317 [Solea senegalensis]